MSLVRHPCPRRALVSLCRPSHHHHIHTPKLKLKHQKRKSKAKFVIRTVGIKAYKDKDNEQARKHTQIHTFQCLMCGSKHHSTRELNAYFKSTHDMLKCTTCGKGFLSPLSLHKHQYVHMDCKHNCPTCRNVSHSSHN